MNTKNHAIAASSAAAIVAAGIMLLLGILGNLGLYMGAAEMMRQWHMFFSLSIGGIMAGMAEAAIITFATVYAFVWVEQKLSSKLGR